MDTSNKVGEPVQVESAAVVRDKSKDEEHGFVGTVQVGRAVWFPLHGVRIGRRGADAGCSGGQSRFQTG